jgi:hypothetical protein
MHAALYGDLPPNPSTIANIPKRLDDVIMTALRKEKSDRYTDVARFAEALREAAQND